MPDIFQILTEARIREWQDRPEKERSATRSAEFQPSSSYEKRLLEEIIELIDSAEQLPQERAEKNRAAAGSLEIQLMASLEKQGLNLTARRIADEITEHRTRWQGAQHPSEQDADSPS